MWTHTKWNTLFWFIVHFQALFIHQKINEHQKIKEHLKVFLNIWEGKWRVANTNKIFDVWFFVDNKNVELVISRHFQQRKKIILEELCEESFECGNSQCIDIAYVFSSTFHPFW